MSTVATFIDEERAHNVVIRAGYAKGASEEAKAARVAAEEARGVALGITKQKAGVNLISPNGELQMNVSAVEVGDARRLLANEPLVWNKDTTRGELKVKAGDPREPSLMSKFLVENVDALSNNKTNKTGLDAITFQPGKSYAVAYMKPEAIKSDLETVKAATAHARGVTILIEKATREKAIAAKAKGQGMAA